MRVRMLFAITGTRNGEDWPAIGGEIDLPDVEAADMCAAGLSERVEAAVLEITAPAATVRPRKKAAQ